jgi:cell division protein FtsI/penicillin-binding protein 2
MATVAAAVASGQPRPPVLVPGRSGPAVPAALPPEVVGALRDLMRQTVERGTAEDLRDRGEVFAKTGTAEYGTEQPPRTHAWVIGFRGGVAFAVLVEDGESGAHDAVPVADRFLSALP